MATTSTFPDQRQDLKARLSDARARTDTLFRIVRREALHDRPILERHRIVFYIGHLEAFDWNLIGRRTSGSEPFHEAFDKLFAFGIDPTDGGLPNEPPSAWPALDEVERYNQRVREAVDSCLAGADLSGAANPLLENGLVFEVAIEHRLMHAETLAYMLHQLPHDRKVPEPQAPATPARGATPRTVGIPAGTATLGLARRGKAFGWDNEFEEHAREVPGFGIDALDVTNGQFLEFMADRGYERHELWSEGGWAWKEQQRVRHPGFWVPEKSGAWKWRGMFEDVPLPLEWPVYASHAEAEAYARWRGKSLPTEAQFHRAAYATPEGPERPYPWGHEPPDPTRGNFDFKRWDPSPVGSHPRGDSAFGVSDLVGNGWEWTRSLFEPFPGFEAFPFYPGYSANFFDGKHYVMKGGSSRTAACMLRRSFRNWFQGYYPHVYASFRCVED